MVPILSIPIFALKLEDRLLPLLITSGTYAMRWFASAHFRLQKISERSTSKIGQLIPLFFCFPCFYLSNMAFQIVYTLRHRKLVRLSVQCARLSGKDHVVKLDDLILKQGGIAQAYGRLRYIASRIETVNGALNREKINHQNRLSALHANLKRLSPSA